MVLQGRQFASPLALLKVTSSESEEAVEAAEFWMA
jgi:hypothetical protein